MRIVERTGDRRDYRCYLICWHTSRIPVTQQARCVGSVDVVHRDPQLAVELASIIHAHDVRMPKRGSEVRFPDESLAVVLVTGHIGTQNLERVAARQPRMLGEVYLTHPPRPQQADDCVPGEYLTVR